MLAVWEKWQLGTRWFGKTCQTSDAAPIRSSINWRSAHRKIFHANRSRGYRKRFTGTSGHPGRLHVNR